MKYRNSVLKYAGAAGLVGAAGSAHAAIPAEVGTGFTAVLTDFNALLALAYPLMIAIVTGMVIFGMVKGFIRKAAGH
ncbi:MAG: hypothetical protein HZC43_02245 [Nitrosomonadales bacterium]|nr:hypothetical protein [Nitrosomonadales bacterium]